MASTHTLRTIQAAATTHAAGASLATGTAVDITTKYGGVLTAKITNGSGTLGVPATLSVMVSGDNTNWKTFAVVTHSVTSTAVGEWAFDIPMGVMYVNVTLGGNTTVDVTWEAFLQELTTI